MEAWALGGWQVGGVFEASTGAPFTPGIGGDALGVRSTDPNVDVPDLVRGPGCRSLVNTGNPQQYINSNCFAMPAAPGQAFWSANCDPFPPSLQSSSANAPPVPAPFPLCFNLRGNL